ncbi:hypothetical protein CLAVI_000924 [Candidatus Clavichlamydia salmonicola]|uniref:hypothetical protein n=1 Tax=Candidatus Clavichlamydia salmonicola TaxID=469812 RepID=UPI001890D164|nr:hypothetical protein [Candidatus Clavichlamydia salmonicola]MBF5051283.1 hypothetical protein [Candidatus Clavichlamydia salmonicola]
MTKPLVKKINLREVAFGLLMDSQFINSILPGKTNFQRFFGFSSSPLNQQEETNSLGTLPYTISSEVEAPAALDLGNPSAPLENPMITQPNVIDTNTFAYLRHHFLPISGGYLTGSIDLGSIGRITSLANPIDIMDAVNLQTLQRSLSLLTANDVGAISTSGGNINGIINLKGILKINGSLNMQGSTLSNLRDPITGTDPVTMQYMYSNVLPISGGTMSGSIIMNGQETITGLRSPIFPTDAVNLAYLQEQLTSKNPFSLNTLLITGGTMQGDIFMDSSYTLKNLPDPKEGSQPVTLHFLQRNYLSLEGGSLRQSLYMGNQRIYGLSDPIEEQDAVNLRTVSKMVTSYMQSAFESSNDPDPLNEEEDSNNLKISGEMIVGTINLNNCGTLTGIIDPSNESDVVSLKYLETCLFGFSETLTEVKTKLENSLKEVSQSIIDLSIQATASQATLHEVLQKPLNEMLITSPLNNLTISSSLNMDFHRITGLASPENPFDAVNQLYLESTLAKAFPSKNQFLMLTGGSMLGSLNMELQTLTGIPNPASPTDAVNLGYLNSRIASMIDSFTESSSGLESSPNNDISLGAVSTGSAVIGGHRIRGLGNPKEAADAVNLFTLDSKISAYLPLKGSIMGGRINMGNYSIKDLADPIDDKDAVNLQTLTSQINTITKKFISSNGGSMSGLLNMGATVSEDTVVNGFRLTGIPVPVFPTDAVNLFHLNNSLNNTVNKNGDRLNGSLDFQNLATVTGLADPVKASDAVNLRVLHSFVDPIKEKFVASLPLSGGVMKGPIDMGGEVSNYDVIGGFSLTGLATPKQPGDAVNLHYIDTILQSYLSVLGGSIFGSIDFGRNGTVTGLRNPINPTDAVNLQTLNNLMGRYQPSTSGDAFTDYLHIGGGVMNGNINMASFSITGLGDPIDLSDAVNLEYLILSLSDLLPTAGGNLSGSIICDRGITIKNVAHPIEDGDVVNLYTLNQRLYELESCISPLCFSLFNKKGIISNPLNMNNFSITSLADPSRPQDAMNLRTFDKTINTIYTQLGSLVKPLPIEGGSLAGSLSMSNFSITDLQDPKNQRDAVNLKTLDERIKNLVTWMECVIIPSNKSAIAPLETFNKNLSLNSFKIIDLADPENLSDAVNLKTLKYYIENASFNSIAPSIESSNFIVKHNICMNSYRITSLGNASNPEDAVNLFILNKKINSALATYQPTITQPLNMNLFSLTGIKDPQNPLDAVNLQTLQYYQSTLATNSSSPTQLSNPTVKSDLNMSNFRITGLRDPYLPDDAVNLRFLQYMIGTCASGSSANSKIVITEPLNMNSFALTGLKDPIDPLDAVNYQTLQAALKETPRTFSSPSIFSFAIDKDICMNAFRLTGLGNPSQPTDAVNFQTLQYYVASNMSPNSSSTLSSLINSDVNMNAFALTGLKDPSRPDDAVNLRYLEAALLKATGTASSFTNNIINSSIDMNSFKITGLPNPTVSSDAVNLQYLNNRLLSLSCATIGALSISGGIVKGKLNMNGNALTGIPNPTNPSDAVPFEHLQHCGFLDAFISRPHHYTQASITNNMLNWKKEGDVIFQSSLSSNYFQLTGNNNNTILLLAPGLYEINVSLKPDMIKMPLGLGSLQITRDGTTYEIGFLDGNSLACGIQSSWAVPSSSTTPDSVSLVFENSLDSVPLSGLYWTIKVFRLPS